MTQRQPPIARFRDQGLTVSLWQRDTEKGVFYDVSFSRSYRAQDGEWQNATNCPAGDIQTLRKLLDLAHTEILAMAEDK